MPVSSVSHRFPRAKVSDVSVIMGGDRAVECLNASRPPAGPIRLGRCGTLPTDPLPR